jgi:cellulose biosynthesis protein BcsQ
MGFFESIDWMAIAALFGEYGKVGTAVFGIVIGAISFAAAYFKYHHGKTDEGVRRQLEHLLRQRQGELAQKYAELESVEAELITKEAALVQADAALRKQREDIAKREGVLDTVRSAFTGKEGDLWCLHPPRLPAGYSRHRALGRKPIILVANLKGGVGKTTLTTNLAAYFTEKGKRVLLLDCDYQGSLSNMVQSADGVTDLPRGIIHILSSEADDSAFAIACRPFSNVLKGASIIPARYELASLENRILIEHLLGEDADDGRYRLANAILTSRAVDAYDVILIDAPPRLTAAAINAFCVSTHLLIPTLYDGLSSEAVGTFLDSARKLRSVLNHEIDALGVVGMLTAQKELKLQEAHWKEMARQQALEAWGTDVLFFDRHIPRKQDIANAAGQAIAYYEKTEIRDLFKVLGDEIYERLGLDLPASPRRRIDQVFSQIEQWITPQLGAQG